MFNRLSLVRFGVCLPLVFSLAGCQLFSKGSKQKENSLPPLAIASAVLSINEPIRFVDKRYTLLEINSEVYPSTMRISQESEVITVEANSWEISNNVLIFAALSNPDRNQKSTLAQIKFHDLTRLWENFPEPANPAIPFPRKNFVENDLEFFKNGVISLQNIRENDAVNNLDDTAQCRVFWDGQEYSVNVREFSHTRVASELVIAAEEVFTGNRENDGATILSLHRTEGAFSEAIKAEPATLIRSNEAEFGNFLVTMESLPIAPKSEAIGVETKPEGYRCILSIKDSKTGVANEFVLNPDQSQRWGNFEWMLNEVNAEQADVMVYEYSTAKYPTPRRAEGDLLPSELATEKAKPAKWIERELVPGDEQEYQGAIFKIVSIRAFDSSNLFDDHVEVSVVSKDLAQTIMLKEGTKQIVRGNNRWWIIEAKDVVAEGSQRLAILRLESEQIVGPKK